MSNQPVLSSSFSSPPSWEYDVFLSFRGEDTRTNFTDHFYKALDDKAITTFSDHRLKRGEEISPALLKAIEESRMSIIVFSENYASSGWCLDELVHILECRKSRQQIVWPVFYKVDPSDVRKQTSNFGNAFTKLKCKFEDSQEKILTWTSALRDAANLSGYTFREGEYEATFIRNIVNEILVLVRQRTHLDVGKYQVGMESCVEEVKELLGVGGNDPCVVEIWGASGIYKITVAKTVYKAIAYKFEGVESAEEDLKSSEVTVTGVFDPAKLIDYVHKRNGKHAAIVEQEPEKKEKEEAKEAKDEKKGGEEGDKEKKGKDGGCDDAEAEENKENTADNDEAAAAAAAGGAPEGAAAEETKVVELKHKNEYSNYYTPRYIYTMEPYSYCPYHNYTPRYAYPLHQIFSDENPNACSIM